jgi:hypothetical protein
VEQSPNPRSVPRVGQSLPNTHSKRADGVIGVQVTQVKRAARAQARDERAVPRVTTIARVNTARQI